MLDLALHPTPTAIAPDVLDRASDAELDALSFGVVALDPQGVVLRYNLYESRLARLDRRQVIGRTFFGEIAPCTRGIFEERCRRVLSGQVSSERFDFVFDFRFGAQEVSVEVVRQRSREGIYLLINRSKVLPPRAGIDPTLLAAAQTDLAPGEAGQGVLRDAMERRVVRAPAPLFAALRATCEKLAPETWQVFATEWGVAWGRRAAVDLESTALERWARSLKEIPMLDLCELVTESLREQGWGGLTFELAHLEDGSISLDLARSALAEAAPPRATASGGATCHLLAGYLSAVLSHVAQRKLSAREITCAANAGTTCSFLVVGSTRRKSLDAAIERGVRDPGELRRVLQSSGRAIAGSG